MQRRQLLKWLVPAGLLATGLAVGVSRWTKTTCDALALPSLLKQLQPFSDASLGQNITQALNANDLSRFNGLCEANFAEAYRNLLAKDFAEGKTTTVDGWILSETEAVTHQLVYQSASHTN